MAGNCNACSSRPEPDLLASLEPLDDHKDFSKVERFHHTLLAEYAYIRPYRSEQPSRDGSTPASATTAPTPR